MPTRLYSGVIQGDEGEVVMGMSAGGRGVRAWWLLAGVCLALAGLPVLAAMKRTQEEAAAALFPGARLERRTVFLTSEQMEAVARAAGAPLDSALVYVYDAMIATQTVGTVYLDVHRVRTLPETLLLAVNVDRTIRGVEVLDFHEPQEYLPGARWYAQFAGRSLDEDLQLKHGIDGVSGATLTARATVRAVRRMLALHQVLQGAAAGKPAVAVPPL